jgi:hypothetical protein
MQKLKDYMEERLGPLWGALVAGISTLYGLWPVISLYKDLVTGPGGGGVGWVPFLLLSPMAMILVMIFVVYLLGGLLCTIDSALARTLICLIVILFYLFKQGVPHPIGLAVVAFVFVISYVGAGTARQDSRDREEFFDE